MNQIDNTVCLLNIGLSVEDDAGNVIGTLKPHAVFNTIKAYGIKNLHTVRHDSASEPTLVVRCVVPSANAVYAVASLLNQDCIAVFDVEHQTGHLIGPAAEKWGAFDPTRFLVLTGERLSTVPDED